MNDKSSLHEGHRQRLKNKFIEHGFQGFEQHNILELLLFYSIPRKDTNEIAHDLLNSFGSLEAVFNAKFEDLIKVEGIKENSATLIKMIPAIAREYLTDSFRDQVVFDTADIIGKYLINKYVGETNEVVYAMFLNNKFELLGIEKVHEGSVNSSQISTRKLIDSVLKFNASLVIIAHNHPDGTVCPSMDDIETTAHLIDAFTMIDTKLVEHFVVAGDQYCPILNKSKLTNGVSEENRYLFRKL